MHQELREAVVLSNQGQKIFGVLHLPKGVKKPASVLICHGLGGHKTGKYRIYVDLAEALVSLGLAVFRFDFRGSGDSEGSFGDMTLDGEVSDALVALEYLQKHPDLNPNKIGIFGRSLGGSVAVITASKFPIVKSIALWAPIFNGDQWQHLWAKTQDGLTSEHELLEFRRINGQVAGLAFYAQLFQMEIPKKLEVLRHVPLLLMHGLKDETVKPVHSVNYLHERKKAKAKTELVELPQGDHDFTHTLERADAVDKTAQWFKDTL